ncbi:MAG: HAD family hydrolase [Methylococcales bacterium]
MTLESNRKSLPEFSAVILDLDGLVIDSEPTYQAAWKQTGYSMGYPIREDLLGNFAGKSYDLIEQLLKAEFGPGFPIHRFREKSAECWRESVESSGIPVKPGLHALLAAFEQYTIPYCLATNSEQRYAEKCLHYAGLGGSFPKRITRDQVNAPKPAPEIFLAAAASLGVLPEKCIVLEDSETGALAALAANTVAILVADPGTVAHPVRVRAFAVLENLHQFRQLLDNRYGK